MGVPSELFDPTLDTTITSGALIFCGVYYRPWRLESAIRCSPKDQSLLDLAKYYGLEDVATIYFFVELNSLFHKTEGCLTTGANFIPYHDGLQIQELLLNSFCHFHGRALIEQWIASHLWKWFFPSQCLRPDAEVGDIFKAVRLFSPMRDWLFCRLQTKVVIHGIEAQTIENVLQNWVDRMGYCKSSRGSHWNDVVFHS